MLPAATGVCWTRDVSGNANSVHTGPSATCRTTPATVATSFADLNQPSEAWLDNALIKKDNEQRVSSDNSPRALQPPWLHLSRALLSFQGFLMFLGKDPVPGCQQKEKELQSHSWKCQTLQTQEIILTRNILPSSGGEVEIPE